MRASSKASFDAASKRWEPVLAKAGTKAQAFGEQLFGLADTIAGSASLGRALTDPSRSGQDKAALVKNVVGRKVAKEVAELVAGAVANRWSHAADLPAALELLAKDAVLASAQADGTLETLEDEVFRFERLLAAERDLRLALADSEASLQRRNALVDALVGGKVLPQTKVLLQRAVAKSASRSLFSSLEEVGHRAAARRARLVATVIAAAPLSEAQEERLTGILERAYGRSVQVNVGVDPRLIGGLRITVGDELVDASVLARLDDARRRLAG